MWSDLKLAFRQLLKSPGFTFVAVLTLALGIGACTAIFSVVDAVLLRPLAYPDSDQIVTVWSLNMKRGSRYALSGPDFRDWRAQSHAFSAFAKYNIDEVALSAAGRAEKANLAFVSSDFFRVLASAPRAGRGISEAEWREGTGVLASAEFARKFFGGDEPALHATVNVYGRAIPIVGVMPEGFAFPDRCALWLPADSIFRESTERSAHNYRGLARLAPGVTLEQAQAELAGIARGLELQYPASNTGKGAAVLRLQDYLVRNHRSMLWVMFGAVGVVLLIACTNVANLLLARGARRAREVALRAALGASPWRIVRGLLAETVVLALFAGAAGLALASAGVRALVAVAPAGVPRLNEAGLDPGTLLFTVAISVFVCLVAGLAPSLQSAKADLKSTMGSAGRGIAGGSGRLRSGLVVAQVALSLLLLTGAGLLLRSFQLLSAVDPGFRTEKVLVMQGTYPGSGDAAALQGARFFSDLLRHTATLPGVVSVAGGSNLPVDDGPSNGSYFIEGRADPAPAESARQQAEWSLATPAYFSTLGIAVRRGREFDDRDQAGATPVVVINETMARAAWPNEDPLGHRIRIGWEDSTVWLTIVGVVADTQQATLAAPVGQQLYLPPAQHPHLATELKVIARTAGAPEGLTESFRRAARALNADVPLTFTTAEIMIADTLTAPRFRTLLVGVFAGTAVVLALIGVAGVLACVVAERQRELGIRLALGAQRHEVLTLILRSGLKLVALGLLLGLAAAAATARLLESFLFHVPAFDPLVYGAVAVLFAVIATLACLFPATRATTVDPITALRAE